MEFCFVFRWIGSRIGTHYYCIYFFLWDDVKQFNQYFRYCFPSALCNHLVVIIRKVISNALCRHTNHLSIFIGTCFVLVWSLFFLQSTQFECITIFIIFLLYVLPGLFCLVFFFYLCFLWCSIFIFLVTLFRLFLWFVKGNTFIMLVLMVLHIHAVYSAARRRWTEGVCVCGKPSS